MFSAALHVMNKYRYVIKKQYAPVNANNVQCTHVYMLHLNTGISSTIYRMCPQQDYTQKIHRSITTKYTEYGMCRKGGYNARPTPPPSVKSFAYFCIYMYVHYFEFKKAPCNNS
jgi:hypothetical protein